MYRLTGIWCLQTYIYDLFADAKFYVNSLDSVLSHLILPPTAVDVCFKYVDSSFVFQQNLLVGHFIKILWNLQNLQKKTSSFWTSVKDRATL
jgi:hypothetical protein